MSTAREADKWPAHPVADLFPRIIAHAPNATRQTRIRSSHRNGRGCAADEGRSGDHGNAESNEEIIVFQCPIIPNSPRSTWSSQ
jgi:hypothetical protein